jgi:LuxR family transcriptional regulator, maltose regulon positive regulatory protein
MRDRIDRPRLLEMLDRGLPGPLTLVSAAAGFGKTTLVNSWIDSLGTRKGPPTPAAWLSLDENDSDLEVFLLYFVAAIRTAFPTACANTVALLQAPLAPHQALLLVTLSNEIEQLPARTVLVMDDYHAVRGEVVHNFVSDLIRHWPQRLHLVLITRSNPPLPLAHLRAQGQVTVIRTRDLRFTPEESAAFLKKALAAPLSPTAVDLLDQHFEGWIAGLRLASVSLRDASDVETEVAAMSDSNVEIADYLMDQVVSRQPRAILKFLLVTSILDRFCAPLCECVVAAGSNVGSGNAEVASSDGPEYDVRACIESLERANLFVIPLDNERQWYRYHHLFQTLLQRRLRAAIGPEQVSELHRTAAAWFGGQGLIDEALQHALAADDLDLAARLMARGLCAVLNREDRATLERWLRLLPEDFVKRRPWLLIMEAIALQISWQLTAVWKLLDQIEALLDAGGEAAAHAGDLHEQRALRGLIAILRGQEAFTATCQAGRAVAYCEEALALLPAQWRYARGSAFVYWGMGMRAGGHADDVQRILIDDYESLRGKTDGYALRLLLAVCLNSLETGQLEQVRQLGQVMLEQARLGQLMLMQGWAYYMLGVVHYCWNELDDAAQHFSAIVDKRFAVHTQVARNGMIGLVWVQLARAENATAWQLFELLSQLDLDRLGRESDNVRALRAQLAYWQGDREKALRWADGYTTPVPDRLLNFLQDPHLTRAHLLLARGTAADVEAVLAILSALHAIAKRAYSVRLQIEILALQALALETQGKAAAASAALQQAVELARPGGFIRVFVDLGPRMQSMLLGLGQGGLAENVRSILAAFSAPQKRMAAGPHVAGAKFARLVTNAGLVEPLTDRELDVLALLRERLSDKEIAHKLGLSTATVKRHAANLYGKLGVNTRRDAVLKAEALGILAPR